MSGKDALGGVAALLLLGVPAIVALYVVISGIRSNYEDKKPEYKKKPEDRKYYYIKNCSADDIPPYDEEVYLEHKDIIDEVMEKGMLNKRIATYVVTIAFRPNRYELEKSIASLQKAIIEEYGKAGAIYRYNYALGVINITGIITEEEVKEYSKILQDSLYQSGY